jgi:serine/threonine-protein kinase
MTTESTDSRLADLLLRWEELQERGEEVGPEELCGGDPALADELSRRIAALRGLGPVLASTDDEPGTSPTATGPPGATAVDPGGSRRRSSATCRAAFEDLRFHAEGGLGEVYLARGDDLYRDVALKFIKRGQAADPESRRRFLLEAEVTGRLEHPGVVPVYGLGLDDRGEPCYAMRFIRGESLQDALEAFHAADGPGRDPDERARALRALLHRFVSVCNTVAYAHSRGVLHRDLKPRNIMLGKYDETLVVDWGLAKPFDRGAADPGLPTAEETLMPSSGTGSGDPTAGGVGTPAYASPEQADGRPLGPTSDVYGLGATLYAVLAGRAPFGGRGRPILALLDQVRRGEFPAPGQVKAGVPRALEAICLRAMALRPEDRYPTALDLADDVERWLADEPVSAWREPWPARAGRWMRRHRTAAVGAAAFLATAAVALAASTLLIGREKVETDKARVRAEANFRKARDAVRAMLDEVGSRDLRDLPHLQAVRRSVLERALAFHEGFLREGATGATRLDAGLAFGQVGEIRALLGEPAEAEAAFDRAVALLRASADEPATSREAREGLATALNQRGMLVGDQGRYPQALEGLGEAIRLLEGLRAADPDDPSRPKRLADVLNNRALILRRSGREAGAVEADLRRAQGLVVPFGEADPEDRRRLARIELNLGGLLYESGPADRAEASLRRAIDLLDRLVAEAPDDPQYRKDLIAAHISLCGALAATHRFDEGEGRGRRAVDLAKALVVDFPGAPVYKDQEAKAWYNLGQVHGKAGRVAEAEECLKEAIATHEALVAALPTIVDHRFTLARGYLQLGLLLAPTPRGQEARRPLLRAKELLEGLADQLPDDAEYRRRLGKVHYGLALLDQQAGRGPPALAGYRKAIAAQEGLAESPSSPLADRMDLGRSLLNLASLLAGMNPAEAESLARRAVDLFPAGATPSEAAEVPAQGWGALGFFGLRRGEFREARDRYERALDHFQAATRSPTWLSSLKGTYAGLIEANVRLGDHEALARTAESWLRDAGTDQETLRESAGLLARGMPLAERDPDLTEADRERRSGAYGDRAVELLRQAVRAGFRDAKALRDDPELRPLQARDDFAALLKEVEDATANP